VEASSDSRENRVPLGRRSSRGDKFVLKLTHCCFFKSVTGAGNSPGTATTEFSRLVVQSDPVPGADAREKFGLGGAQMDSNQRLM